MRLRKDEQASITDQEFTFVSAVTRELAQMRANLVRDDGLKTLVLGHPEFREQLLPTVEKLGSDVFAADAHYGVEQVADSGNGQVRLYWNLYVVLASDHRMVVVRADRSSFAQPHDSNDAINRAVLALTSQKLAISYRIDIPTTSAGLMSVTTQAEGTPVLRIQALGDVAIPLGSVAMAERVIDKVAGRAGVVAPEAPVAEEGAPPASQGSGPAPTPAMPPPPAS